MPPQVTTNKLKFIKFKRNFQKLSTTYKSIPKCSTQSPSGSTTFETIDKKELESKVAIFANNINLGLEKTETLIESWDPFENQPKLEEITEIIKLADLAILKGIALTEVELEAATSLCRLLHDLIDIELIHQQPTEELQRDKDFDLDLINSQSFYFIPNTFGHELVKTISASELTIREGKLDPELAKRPFKVQGLIDDWPAMQSWSFENFLKRFWFRSTVIEIGRKYTDANWKQKIITIHEYIIRLVNQSKHIEILEKRAKKSSKVSDRSDEDAEEEKEKCLNSDDERESTSEIYGEIDKLEVGSPNEDSPSQKLANIKRLSDELLASGSVGTSTCKSMTKPPKIGNETPTTKRRKRNFYDEENLIMQNDSFSNFYLAQNALLNQIPELRDDIEVPHMILNVLSYTQIEPEICAWIGPAGTFSPSHTDPKDNLFCQVKGEKYFKFAGTDGYKSYCYVHPGECVYIPKNMAHQVLSKTTSFAVNFWFG